VPDDLLRLSIGIEARPISSPISRRPRGKPAVDIADKVAAALQTSVLPSVIARGGEIRVARRRARPLVLESDGVSRCRLAAPGRIER
jgi:hypothetical protein